MHFPKNSLGEAKGEEVKEGKKEGRKDKRIGRKEERMFHSQLIHYLTQSWGYIFSHDLRLKTWF